MKCTDAARAGRAADATTRLLQSAEEKFFSNLRQHILTNDNIFEVFLKYYVY